MTFGACAPPRFPATVFHYPKLDAKGSERLPKLKE